MFEWVHVGPASCESQECVRDSDSLLVEGPWEATSFLPLTGTAGLVCQMAINSGVPRATRGILVTAGLPAALGITNPTNRDLIVIRHEGEPLETHGDGNVAFTGRERTFTGQRREGKYYLSVPAVAYVPNSNFPGVYEGSSMMRCWSTVPGVGANRIQGLRSATFRVVNPATLTIAAPATVDFGRVYGGGGEVQMDLPLQLTSNADTRFQLSLSAPALEQNVGSLGSYGYKVLADPTWKDGPSGALSIAGTWYDARMMKGTATYTLRLGLAPTSKPFVAGPQSSNLTVNVRVL